MKVVVVIVSWEGALLLPACLDALFPELSDRAELMVVDNASTDGSVRYVQERWPTARLIVNSRNLGFGGGAEVAFQALLAADVPDVLIVLNQDAVVAPGWLDGMLQPFQDADVGAVGCKMLYPDHSIQHAGSYLEYPRAIAQHIGWHQPDMPEYSLKRDIEYVTGASFALRVAALQKIGFFDDGYHPAYYEDTDLCWRLRQAGYRVVYNGAACAVHQESASTPDVVRRSMLYNRNRLRFVLKTYNSTMFWQDFVPAERLFIARHGVGDEARALRWAYLHALRLLPSTLAARRPLHPHDQIDERQAGRLLIALRRWIGDCARNRLAGTIPFQL